MCNKFEWKMEIRKVGNGFICKYVPDGGEIEIEEVFEEKQDKEHIIEMLWLVVDHFGELGSKHDEKRICIDYKESEI